MLPRAGLTPTSLGKEAYAPTLPITIKEDWILFVKSVFSISRKDMGQDKPQGIAPTLGDIIGAFKSVTTNAYIRGVNTQDWPPFDGRLWQRNYYEHIIRHARSHQQIAEYIATNPLRWEQDRFHAY